MGDQETFSILLYHGVSSKPHKGIENFHQKHISVEDFEEQIAYLSKHYHISKMSDINQVIKESEKNIIITFDDGFANNYYYAFPILKKYQVPATFYISTGFIETKEVFWVDKVEYLVNESPLNKIKLDTLKQSFKLNSPSDKILMVQVIKEQLKSETNVKIARQKIESTISELESKAAVEPRYDYDDYLPMTWEQIFEMNQSEWCDIGGHTVDHTILSQLEFKEKKRQIIECKQVLERELDQTINLFSYPEGQRSHYDQETIEILRQYNFISSPSAVFGFNTSQTSCFHLYRNMVGFVAPFKQCLGE